MAAFAPSTPCWVDVQLPDLEAGKRFYGELFGWTFRPGKDADTDGTYADAPYADALSDGRLVAAFAAKRDGRMPTAWGIYFATDDIAATVDRIRRAGGQVITEPVRAGSAGVLAQAVDPGGAVFGLWQAGVRGGFEKQNEPGSFCWTEVYTRRKDRVDAFYEDVFGFSGTDLGGTRTDDAGAGEPITGEPDEEEVRAVESAEDEEAHAVESGEDADEARAVESGEDEPRTGGAPGSEPGTAEFGVDFRMWSPAGTEPGPDTAVAGRSVITDAFPAEMPSYFLSYFTVEDCDATAETVVRLGGRVSEPPFDIPYGRMAVLHDDQGAEFAVLQPLVSG
ncbi:VOC family protein [Streptomyces sp. NBC_00316]|uniref:VOC family protein n=1 Tax=Streptomyces sp. NBC_00316 TaxID=2975710 RepID=UPI002E2BEA5D|nr:VOC family protein [Streptomyces sp. NBC_00316]